jgi:Fic family protein
MVYLEIIKRNKKEYYYLTKNIRQDLNKWKKIRIFLGDKKPNNNEIKKAIEKIEKKYNKLRLSSYKYLNEENAELLEDLKNNFQNWKDKLPQNIIKNFEDDFVIRFTYNSNAIEGNKLTLRETSLILKDKIIPSGIKESDYNEAINGKACLNFIKEYNGNFDLNFMIKVNEILTKNTDVAYPGRLRFFDVRIQGSNYIPPKHELVKKYVNDLFSWYKQNKNKMHVFELASIFHAKLVWIHPFEDGNGRTARTLMNYILLKKGYPMFYIPYEKRQDYYNAIELADNKKYKGYITKMLKLIKEQITGYSKN